MGGKKEEGVGGKRVQECLSILERIRKGCVDPLFTIERAG